MYQEKICTCSVMLKCRVPCIIAKIMVLGSLNEQTLQMYVERLKKSDQKIFDKIFLTWKISLSQKEAFLRGELEF